MVFHTSCFPSQYRVHNTNKFYSHLERSKHTRESHFQQICMLLFSRSRKLLRWFSSRIWKSIYLVSFPEDSNPIFSIWSRKSLFEDNFSCRVKFSNTLFAVPFDDAFHLIYFFQHFLFLYSLLRPSSWKVPLPMAITRAL